MTKIDEFTRHIQDKDRYELYIYEQLVDADPDFVDALFPMAELYTQVGQYKKGLEVDIRLARLYPDDSSVIYNLACSYSLCAKPQQSLDALEKAVSLGFDDIEHIESDEDLDNIRNQPRYAVLIGNLRNKSI